MDKKKFRTITVLGLIILFVSCLSIPNYLIMRKKAVRTFNEILAENNLEIIKKEFFGPIIKDNIGKKGICFQWYKPLDYNDTAFVNILIHYYFPLFNGYELTMSDGWKFLFGPSSNFRDLIHQNKSDSNQYDVKFMSIQDSFYIENKTPFILVGKEKLRYYLKNGYFDILKKENEKSIIVFYKQIGEVLYDNNLKSSTIGAIISVDSLNQVLVTPIPIPDSLWYYYKSSKTYVPFIMR